MGHRFPQPWARDRRPYRRRRHQMSLYDLRNIAEAATPGPWEATTSEVTMNDRSLWRIGDPHRPHVAQSVMRQADAEFFATFDPQRVLELLARLAAVEELHQPVETPGCDNPACCDTTPLCGKCVTPWPCDTIK